MEFRTGRVIRINTLLVVAVFTMSLMSGIFSQAASAEELPQTLWRGVNLAGAEFGGTMPGTVNVDYTYPTEREMDYYNSRGQKLIRLPFKWERIQRHNSSTGLAPDLHEPDMLQIDQILQWALARDMKVILNMHNYARYKIGRTEYVISPEPTTAKITTSHFKNIWEKIANRYTTRSYTFTKGDITYTFPMTDAIWAYGLMNEPHDMPNKDVWPKIAQAGINGVRAGGDTTGKILVAGDYWSSAMDWLKTWGCRGTTNCGLNNEVLHQKVWDTAIPASKCSNPGTICTGTEQDYTLADNPANKANILFEAHQYFDSDGSGTYKSGSVTDPMLGVKRLQGWFDWLNKNGLHGFMGEFGVPSTDPKWFPIVENVYKALEVRRIPSTYWSGGPWWGTYNLSIEPNFDSNNVVTAEKPVMTQIIQNYPTAVIP